MLQLQYNVPNKYCCWLLIRTCHCRSWSPRRPHRNISARLWAPYYPPLRRAVGGSAACSWTRRQSSACPRTSSANKLYVKYFYETRKYFSYRRDKLWHDLPGLDHAPVEAAEEVVPLDVLLGPGAQPLTRVAEQQRGDQALAVPADRPGVSATDVRCYN